MRCTDKASATPSMTATTAAALRQGWWRSSCQEKDSSRAGSTRPGLRRSASGQAIGAQLEHAVSPRCGSF